MYGAEHHVLDVPVYLSTYDYYYRYTVDSCSPDAPPDFLAGLLSVLGSEDRCVERAYTQRISTSFQKFGWLGRACGVAAQSRLFPYALLLPTVAVHGNRASCSNAQESRDLKTTKEMMTFFC